MILTIIYWFYRFFLTGVFSYTGYIRIQAPIQFSATLSGYQLIP